jgi:Ca2+:H+ antiporter
VLGLAFVVATARRGPQPFTPQPARDVAAVLLSAAAVVVVVSTVALGHTAAARHLDGLSIVGAVVLLVGYGASLAHGHRFGSRGPASESRPAEAATPSRRRPERSWVGSVAALTGASLAAAVVSDWFVAAIHPALHQLGVTDTFVGVVVVAVAGNAVEQVGSIALAVDGRTSHAVTAILESTAQVLLGVFPLLVLAGVAVGTGLTLAVPPLLLAGLGVSCLVAMAVVVDGEATWLEGCCLIGLHAVIAAAWWGG